MMGIQAKYRASHCLWAETHGEIRSRVAAWRSVGRGTVIFMMMGQGGHLGLGRAPQAGHEFLVVDRVIFCLPRLPWKTEQNAAGVSI